MQTMVIFRPEKWTSQANSMLLNSSFCDQATTTISKQKARASQVPPSPRITLKCTVSILILWPSLDLLVCRSCSLNYALRPHLRYQRLPNG